MLKDERLSNQEVTAVPRPEHEEGESLPGIYRFHEFQALSIEPPHLAVALPNGEGTTAESEPKETNLTEGGTALEGLFPRHTLKDLASDEALDVLTREALIRKGHPHSPPGVVELAKETVKRELEARWARRGSFDPHSLPGFLAKPLPPVEPLVEGLVNKRDLVALIGRRRHGKTTLLCNLALAVTEPKAQLLGHPIHGSHRAVMFYLEDDPSELRGKLAKMCQGGVQPARFHLYTKGDFRENRIGISIHDRRFQEFVLDACQKVQPDLVGFDNLAHLIGADYLDSTKIHAVVEFAYKLQNDFGTAVLIAAHPRKRGRKEDDSMSLTKSPEAFFEGCMGSSHFVNSFGSLWGIERDQTSGHSYFVGGTQRFDGTQGIACLDKNDSDWFEVVDDFQVNFSLAVNTEKRQQAWKMLPEPPQAFTYTEAAKAVESVLKRGSFDPWFKQLKRLKIVVPVADGRLIKQLAQGSRLID